MNNSVQILRLAFFLSSFCNILGWVESASVGRGFKGESEVTNASNFVRKRRMILGLGSEEASPSYSWSYWITEPAQSWGFVKRHQEKKLLNSNTNTSKPKSTTLLFQTKNPLSKGKRSIVVSSLQESLASPASDSSKIQPNIVLSQGKRPKVVRSSQRRILSRASDSSQLQPEIVLANGKLSTNVISHQRSILPRASGSSGLESKIVLSKGKRSQVTSSTPTGNSQSKIVLVNGQRSSSTRPRNLQSEIQLPNGQTSEQTSYPKYGISSRASDPLKTSNKTHLHGDHSQEDILKNSRPASGRWARRNKRSESTAASKNSSSDSDIVLASQRPRLESVNGPSRAQSTIEQGKKTKRHELGLMTENFAKPLPIFELFGKY